MLDLLFRKVTLAPAWREDNGKSRGGQHESGPLPWLHLGSAYKAKPTSMNGVQPRPFYLLFCFGFKLPCDSHVQ